MMDSFVFTLNNKILLLALIFALTFRFLSYVGLTFGKWVLYRPLSVQGRLWCFLCLFLFFYLFFVLVLWFLILFIILTTRRVNTWSSLFEWIFNPIGQFHAIRPELFLKFLNPFRNHFFFIRTFLLFFFVLLVLIDHKFTFFLTHIILYFLVL